MESGSPKKLPPKNTRYVKAEQDGLVLYIRSDMRFTGGVASVDVRTYKGQTFLVVRNPVD